jgi:hypothetical protein
VVFPGDATAMVSRVSFRYLSRTTVAIRFFRVPCFVRNGIFLVFSSLVLYYFEAPIYFIIFRKIISLDQAWPTSRILIYIEANQVIGLFVIYIEPGRSAIVVGVVVLLRLGYKVLRILEWTSVSIS